MTIAHRLTAVVVLAVAAAWSGASAAERSKEQMTPLLLAVPDPPIPFKGSDGRTHLVYELWMTNFSSGEATVEQVDVLGDGRRPGDARRSRGGHSPRSRPAGATPATPCRAAAPRCCSST